MKQKSSTIDSDESLYLYVEPSQIPFAGLGLYTAIDIYKDELIACFKGELLTNKQVQKRVLLNEDQYFIALLNGRILDSKHSNCFAKYANDVKGTTNTTLKNNARILLDEQEQVCLFASKRIQSGSEIFCGYGKKYWLKHLQPPTTTT